MNADEDDLTHYMSATARLTGELRDALAELVVVRRLLDERNRDARELARDHSKLRERVAAFLRAFDAERGEPSLPRSIVTQGALDELRGAP